MIWHHHVAWGQYRAGPRAHSSEQRTMTEFCGSTTDDAQRVRRRVSVPPDSGGTESIVTNPGGILT